MCVCEQRRVCVYERWSECGVGRCVCEREVGVSVGVGVSKCDRERPGGE